MYHSIVPVSFFMLNTRTDMRTSKFATVLSVRNSRCYHFLSIVPSLPSGTVEYIFSSGAFHHYQQLECNSNYNKNRTGFICHTFPVTEGGDEEEAKGQVCKRFLPCW